VARLQVDLVASLLDVMDDLERVADSGAGTTADAVVEGIRLVEKKFLTVLTAAGLEAIDAEGELFDPEVMEAMATVRPGRPAPRTTTWRMSSSAGTGSGRSWSDRPGSGS
jgi:molecular chaperone GrpE (heat shock protein)